MNRVGIECRFDLSKDLEQAEHFEPLIPKFEQCVGHALVKGSIAQSADDFLLIGREPLTDGRRGLDERGGEHSALPSDGVQRANILLVLSEGPLQSLLAIPTIRQPKAPAHVSDPDTFDESACFSSQREDRMRMRQDRMLARIANEAAQNPTSQHDRVSAASNGIRNNEIVCRIFEPLFPSQSAVFVEPVKGNHRVHDITVQQEQDRLLRLTPRAISPIEYEEGLAGGAEISLVQRDFEMTRAAGYHLTELGRHRATCHQ